MLRQNPSVSKDMAEFPAADSKEAKNIVRVDDVFFWRQEYKTKKQFRTIF